MDDKLKDIFDDSNGSDSSTDLDEYDTAEDDCDESYYSLDESSVKNEVLKGEDDYPDIEFIDEDNRHNENHEIFNKQWSSKTETVLGSDILNYDNSNTNTLKDNISYDTGKSSSDEFHDSSLQLFDDQRPLSFHEKLSFFEKIGRKTDKVYTKSHDINADALKSHDDIVVDTKEVVNEEDSSDETDGSSAANETSYEDLLESTLEKAQIENLSRRSSSGSEGLENLDASFVDNKIVPTDTIDRESGDIKEESQVSGSEQLTYLKHEVESETSSLNIENICNDSLISAEIPDTDEHTLKDLAKPEMREKQAGSVEQRVTLLNDLSHQNLFSCTKTVCEAGETREPEMAKQAVSKIVTPKRKNSRCEITAEDLKTLKKTFLLPLRPGEQVAEANELSDHMINRQSSVIKDNHLTEMPFTDYSDSEILNDVKDSQEFKKTRVVKSEPAQEAVLRYVELGTASLLEGSHYKNLRCAKIVSPFIADKNSDLDELKSSSYTDIAIENTENVPDVTNINRRTVDVLGITKKEDAIVSDVVAKVTDYNLNCSEKDTDTTEHVESPERALEERDKNRKSGNKSLRRRFWRHKAIVSEYVANIKQAESLRNSGGADDVIGTNADVDSVKPDMDSGAFSQENRNSFKSKDIDLIVRTVDIGTACLYEIPHLKYLHCARIISPPS